MYLARHFDQVIDQAGNAYANATITVTRWDGAAVSIYSNRDATGGAIVGSQVQSNSLGLFEFYAVPGVYKLTVTNVSGAPLYANDVNVGGAPQYSPQYFGIREGANNDDITTPLQNWVYEILGHANGVVASGRLPSGQINLPDGVYYTDSLFWHPAISLYGSNRAGTRLILKNNATAIGVDNVRAMFYLLARTHEIQATGAWNPAFSDIRLSGNKGNQSNQYCYGIYCEKGENDPHYEDYLAGGTELKSYGAAIIENTEIEGFSGTGVRANGDRQRLTMYGRSRSINHGIMSGDTVITGANGVHILGNDPVISDCGFGGCTGHSVLAAGCSGVLMRGNNVWGTTSAARSREALAMHLQNTNGACIVANTFNDTVSIFGGDPNNDRSFTFVGNHLKPNKQVFTADGVTMGTGDEACNAFIRVRGNRNAVIAANDYSSASNGNRYKWLASFTDEAVGSIEFMASTETAGVGQLLIRPWQTDTPVPLLISGNSAATFVHRDAWLDLHRFSGNVVFGMNPNNTPDTATYSLIHGGSKPALFGNRLHLQRGFTLLPTKGQTFDSLTNNANIVIGTNRQRANFYSNGPVDAATIVLPDTPDDGHELELYFRDGVKLLTLSMGSENHSIFGDQFPVVPQDTLIRLTFKYDTAPIGKWWVTSTRNRGLEPYAHKFKDMTNGGSEGMESGLNQHLHLRRTGLCTDYTVTLPTTPQEGEKRRITLHQGVTTWALNPAAGQVLNSTDAWPTTIPAGGFTIECVYHVTSTPENVWYLTRASA